MTIFFKRFAATALLIAAPVLTAPAFANDCSLPETPSVPDGTSASMEEMIAGQKAVKGFQSDVQAYRACVDETLEAMKEAAASGEETAVEAYKTANDAYNASVVAEEKLAEDFNTAVRAYKAANPS